MQSFVVLIVHQRDLLYVEINLDIKVACILLIHTKNVQLKFYITIAYCRAMLFKLQTIKIEHCHRKVTLAANRLANYMHQILEEEAVFKDPSSFLLNFSIKDNSYYGLYRIIVVDVNVLR